MCEVKFPVAAEEADKLSGAYQFDDPWRLTDIENLAKDIADIQRRTILAARDVALADLNGSPGNLVPYTERLDGGASEACARRIAKELERLAASLGEPGK